MPRKLLSLLLCVMFLFSIAFAEDASVMPAPGTFTDIAILSTTDMHGKCWNTNKIGRAHV